MYQFWAPGNLELFVLANPTEQLYSIPFAKSATTGIHSPDNTRYAFLQMDDRVLVYRGADQPDMSVINPESDVWQQIKVSTKHNFHVRVHLRIPSWIVGRTAVDAAEE